LLYAAAQFASIHCGEAENQAVRSRAAGRITAKGHNLDVIFRSGCSCPVGAHPIFQPAHSLQARFDLRNFQQSRQFLPGSVQEYLQPFGIKLPHPPDVPREMSLGDEIA
jgi:hypothetical protein